MSVQVNDQNLGHATAYGYASSKGYTGTEDEFAELMASYADVAEQAAESAEQAAASATTASTKASEAAQSATAAASSKTAAQTAQTGAETAATTATTKAGEASASATTASGKATEATTAAGTATTKASEATTAATTATTKAGEASTSATNAAASATRAQEILDSIPADYSQLSDDVEDLKDGFGDIAESSETQTEITSEQVNGLYINTNPAQFGTANASTFRVKTIPVEAGKTYRIVADQIKTMYDQYALVAFSEQYPAASVSLTVLVNGSTTVIPIDYTYTPEKNGYVSVALISSVNTDLHFYEITDIYHVITDKTLAEINMPADAKETGDRFGLLDYTTESEKEDVVSAEHIVTDRYIATHGTIKTAGSTAFAVAWYPVKTGSTYTISGTASVGGSGQALICFDNVYDSTANHVCKTVIQTASTTATPYNITYAPTEDGYLVMPYISSVKLVVTLVSDTDFQRIYDLEKSVDEIEAEIGKTKMPVKIQLFGDSITDNQWGDKLTWANYIQDNLSDYNVTVVNDAVGGSGIGHGASKGTTESHQTEEYNYVYDLVTDGTTLQTDANYIVILVGTNNWVSGTDLGDMSSTGYATIYGALKGILEYIAQHTKATVFVCTIPQRYNSTDQSRTTNAYGEPLNSDNVSLADYCEPFRKVSAFYGMPCVHLNESLGWNRLNISNFSGDGLHPNNYGDKMLSAFICSEIQKHIGRVSYT